ncbi:MAG: DUF1080 domain-containing protein [Akkermansiaceae bacterium]|nr:DUF1080 domain-containing protein [Akkermansiaceae bacterium]
MRISSIAVLAGMVVSGWCWAHGDGHDVELFNGKDLGGWKVPENNIWWSVEEGTIVAKSGPKKKGSILWTEESFKDFIVEAEFRFDGTGDSGIFLRNSKEQIQIGISGSLKRDMTCSPYIAGKGYPVEAEEAKGTKGVKGLLKIDAWNKLQVRVTGPKYEVKLNGKQVMTYVSETAPKEGPVGLQLHAGKDMKIEFRNVFLRKLGGH